MRAGLNRPGIIRDLRALESAAIEFNEGRLAKFEACQDAVNRRLAPEVREWYETLERARGVAAKRPAMRLSELDAYARAAASQLRHGLDPWIGGRAPLDYSWLRELFWSQIDGGGSPEDRKRRQERLDTADRGRRKRRG